MISYNKKRETYNVFLNNKYFVSYTKSRYGEFAELLAEKSNDTHKKYLNHYEIDADGGSQLYIYSKLHGVIIVKLSNEDVNITSKVHWYMMKHNDNAIYISSSAGPLGRFLLSLDNNDERIVTFKDNDYLNHTRENLLIVHKTERYAQEVLKIYNDKNLVWKNVREQHVDFIHRFRIIYFAKVEGKHVRKCKDIYFNKDNYCDRKHIAIQFSIQKRFDNGYTLTDEDLDYIKEYNIVLD